MRLAVQCLTPLLLLAEAVVIAKSPAKLSERENAGYPMLEFTQCLVSKDRPVAELLLKLPPLDPKSVAPFLKISSHPCHPKNTVTVIGPTFFRGGFYAALYKVDFAGAPGGIGATPIDFTTDVRGDTTLRAKQYVALRQFADCAVRREPAAARALVMAALESEAENQAFGALRPVLNSCMGEGASLAFSRAILIGLVAEALYREAQAAAADVAAGTQEMN